MADAGHFTGVAYAEASEPGLTSYAGFPVGASAGIVDVVPHGDADLDWKIDFDDFAVVDAYVNADRTLSPELLATRAAEFGGDYVKTLPASVPEPRNGGVGVMGVARTCWRWRRRVG